MKRIGIFFSLVVIGALLISGCSSSNSKQIVIGGKNYTEQDILVEILKQTVEAKTDIKVISKPFLGGASIVSNAMDRGDLDVYVEYTGTALLDILKLPLETDPNKTYEIVKKEYESKKNIIWLKALGFNNTYTLTMREDQAKKMKIETISDLAVYAPDLILACEPEFAERPDGYPGLKKAYNIKFKNVASMDSGLMYGALRDGTVDVIDAYGTDGRIVAFNLKVLKDDRNFFPPYYAAPIIRADTLKKYPELESVLNQLAGKLTDKEMTRLNAQVDLEKKSSQTVATEWLKKEGIIE